MIQLENTLDFKEFISWVSVRSFELVLATESSSSSSYRQLIPILRFLTSWNGFWVLNSFMLFLRSARHSLLLAFSTSSSVSTSSSCYRYITILSMILDFIKEFGKSSSSAYTLNYLNYRLSEFCRFFWIFLMDLSL